MSVTWLDKTLRFDRKEAGGRYIRFVWWRFGYGWMPKLEVDAYGAEWWWIITCGPFWLEISPKPQSWEQEVRHDDAR